MSRTSDRNRSGMMQVGDREASRIGRVTKKESRRKTMKMGRSTREGSDDGDDDGRDKALRLSTGRESSTLETHPQLPGIWLQ